MYYSSADAEIPGSRIGCCGDAEFLEAAVNGGAKAVCTNVWEQAMLPAAS